MQITEVRIKLMDEPSERLKAFCSITFDDCFVIRDLKIIDGASGLFVAMPSRKLTARCPQCGCKNHLRAGYCGQCGLRLKDDRASRDESGRAKLYADIAHPINSRCREALQQRVVQAFHEEIEKAKLPGYVSSYDDFDHEDDLALAAHDEYPIEADLHHGEPGKVQPSDRTHSAHRTHAPRHAPPPTVSPVEGPQPAAGNDFGAGIF